MPPTAASNTAPTTAPNTAPTAAPAPDRTTALARWMRSLDATTWRAVRRACFALLAVPVLVLIVARIPRIPERGPIAVYGLSVMSSTLLLFYLAFVRYRDPAIDAAGRRPIAPADQPLVSCFIPVNNEEQNIEACIRSILDGDYHNIELFVIDDGSTDGTPEVLRRIAGVDSRLVVLTRRQRSGKKHALVHAAYRARGKIFLYTDSDCLLAPDAISRCVSVFLADPDVGGVSGHARALNSTQSWLARVQDVWYDGQFAVNKAAESTFDTVTCVSGPLAAFRREAIVNYLPAWANDVFLGEPFLFATDRQLTAYVLSQVHREDTLKGRFADDPLVSKVDHPAREWKINYLKSARVATIVPPTIRAFLRQQVRWKKSFIRNLAFNSPWMWRRGLGPALLYYGHALWVVLAPVMAFIHLVWFPLHGRWLLTALYVVGLAVKGLAWSGAYAFENRGDGRWIYRPVMTVISCALMSWLILWAALTVRKPVWARG